MAVKTLNVNEDILGANDMLAENLRGRFEASRVFVMNLMSSPGAGKTSLILKIIEALSGKHKIGVIEGDIASDVDARKIQKTNVDVVQINTRGACHLDANMILSATESLGLDGKQLAYHRKCRQSGLPCRIQTWGKYQGHDPLHPGRTRQASEVPAHVHRVQCSDSKQNRSVASHRFRHGGIA